MAEAAHGSALAEPFLSAEAQGGSQDGAAAAPGRRAVLPTRQVTLQARQPYASGLYTFLALHYVPFIAQLWLLRTALLDGDRLILGCTCAALAFSGLFYSYVAWCATPQGPVGVGYLPLGKRPLLEAILLAVPYGFLQWVIVSLHARPGRSGRPPEEGEDSRVLSYKAVNAIMESLLTSAAILYTHWTKGLFELQDRTLSLVLSEVVIVASGGLGLLQVDYCCSAHVQQRMKAPLYVWLHGLFRTCEVFSRLSILTGFAVMATVHGAWWWSLIALELVISLYLVLAHGGLRNTRVAVAICTVSATIVNVFCFVDSPSRFESASNISRGLQWKYFIESALALFCMFQIMDVHTDFGLHGLTLGSSVAVTLLYWLLWPFVCHRWSGEPDPRVNIFSACRKGDLRQVQQLTTQAQVRFDLDELDVSGMTPLMHAALGGHSEICRHLLAPAQNASLLRRALGEVQCLPELRRRCWQPAGRQWSAMHFAAWTGDIDVLQVLLQRARDIGAELLQATDADGNTPLHVAGIFGREKAYDLLLNLGHPDWSLLPNGAGDLPRDPRGIQHLLDSDEALDDPSGEALPAPDEAGDASGDTPREALRALDDAGEPRPEEELVPVHGARQHEVPLGLSSFMVCSSTAQVGRIFVPLPLVEPLVPLPLVGGLSFEHLRPCTADETEVPGLDPLAPETWRHPGVFIGQGSFGDVWRARDPEGNIYAVKCMLKNEPQHRSGALREVQVAMAVRDYPHPCLVKVLLYHELQDHICVVMRACMGGTLHTVVTEAARGLRRVGKVGVCPDFRPAVGSTVWLAEVFLGLEYVHLRMKGIIRDLKTKNVGMAVMGPPPASGRLPPMRAMLLDYGSYRLTGPCSGQNSLGGVGRGFQPCSAGYASPELLRSLAFDHRTDLFSFGILMWVTLTGGLGPDAEPFYDPNFQNAGHLLQSYPEMRKLIESPRKHQVPELPVEATALIRGLTERSQARRPSHEDVRASLGRLLARELPEYETPPGELAAWLHAAEGGEP